MKNLLEIHEKIASVDTFINIKMRVESLDINDQNYETLVENTDLLVKVLDAFGKDGIKL